MFWTNLKAAIAAAIKTNNNQEITGAVLQSTLNSIVNSVGANATFAGVATPNTNPGVPDGPVFWIAGQSGQYPNFGNLTIEVTGTIIGIFIWNGSAWSYNPVVINIDDDVNSIVLSKSDVLDESVSIYKGLKSLEFGTLNNNGQPSPSSIRLRSKDFIELPLLDGAPHSIYYKMSSGFAFSMLFYDENKEYLYESYGVTARSGIMNPRTDARYVKLLFRPEPDHDPVNIADWAGIDAIVSLYQKDNDSLKKSILANVDADLHIIKGNILRQEWINRNIAGTFGDIRLSTVGFIPVKQFTSYKVERLVDDENHSLEITLYDENYSALRSFGWNNSFITGPNGHYIKALYKYGDNENVDINTYVPFSIVENQSDVTIEYFPTLNNNAHLVWEYGSIKDDGTNPDTTVQYRARTPYLPIKSPGHLYMVVTSGWGMDVYFFDANKAILGNTQLYTAGSRLAQVPTEAKYFRIKMMPVPDSSVTLDLSAVASSGCHLYDYRCGISNSYLKHLKLSQWNMGLLNHGLGVFSWKDANDNIVYTNRPAAVDGKAFQYSGLTGLVGTITSATSTQIVVNGITYDKITDCGDWGIPNDEYDAEIEKLKSVVTGIDADVLFLNEYSTYVDRNQTKDTYETLFKQFYGYKYTPFNGNVAIVSKYPINVCYENDVANRPYITGEILVDGHAISFCLLHFSPFSYADRTAEINALITKLSSYTQGIVAGDFNFGNNGESLEDIMTQIGIFTNAGFIVGNYGYWGQIATTPIGTALDNICVKGMNMSGFIAYSDHSVSDHIPTCAEVSFLIKKED